MKKVFIKPEMKSHILRTNKMILGSKDCNGDHCYYIYQCDDKHGDKCIAHCDGDFDCALERD